MGDTRVIYHLDGQETPYLVRLSVPADRVTLGDFRSAINKPNYKFFFKSVDVDFG
jgi:segment polarity protein dishevelled|uniref:DIX domain-containing protein n=2 Tax=Gadus TaxID=8048 RepID=A0A8C5BPE2_GADMO